MNVSANDGKMVNELKQAEGTGNNNNENLNQALGNNGNDVVNGFDNNV